MKAPRTTSRTASLIVAAALAGAPAAASAQATLTPVPNQPVTIQVGPNVITLTPTTPGVTVGGQTFPGVQGLPGVSITPITPTAPTARPGTTGPWATPAPGVAVLTPGATSPLPGMPNLPMIPQIPGFPQIPGLPNITGPATLIPQIPGFPQMPGFPQAPTQPGLPTLPTTPTVPVDPGPGDGRVRIYGVFAGITDYPSSNDLPHCADDAREMQRAFVNAGVMHPNDAMVLTDSEVTVARVQAAIRAMNARADGDDLFVFFFSGHGNQTPARMGGEPDGMDEEINFVDGAILDDTFAQMLRGGRGRDLVALDTCYSGGFAHDLAQVPNTISFNASNEHQLSYVAPEFNDGGYLSHYMKEAVEQSRGQIRVGELARRIQAGIASSARGRQDFTMSTGPGVGAETVLFSSRGTAVASR